MPINSTGNIADSNAQGQINTEHSFVCVSLHVTVAEEKMYKVCSWFFQKKW